MDGGAQAPQAGAADRRLWLARHGQTAYNLEGRFQGWLPVPLDDTGRRQAAELAEVVARLTPAALVCSDIARARETAGIVAARIGVEPVVDARFAETETGDWTDRTFADVIAEDPEGFARFAALDPDWGFPGGESFAEQRARVLAGIADWRARDVAGHVVIVCHGNTIRLATLTPDGPATDRPDNGSLVGL
jgi:broad specificity phosphatase PhoE